MRRLIGWVCIGILMLVGEPGQGRAQETSRPELSRLFPPGAQRGQSTPIEVKGKFQSDSVRVWSSVPGLTWTKADGDNQFQVAIDPDMEIGPVFVRLVDAGGASELLPFVVGHHTELNESEPNDRSDQAQVVAQRPVVVNGVLQAGGDVDHFRFSVQAGERLVAVLDAERFLKSAVDATLQLVTTDGQILVQNLDYRGLDPQIVWVADQDREVVLRVFGFPAAPDSTISLGGGEKFLYRLSVTTGAVVEAVEPMAIELGERIPYARRGWNLPTEETLEVPAGRSEETLRMFWPDAVGYVDVPLVAHRSVLAKDVRLVENRLAKSLSPTGSDLPKGQTPLGIGTQSDEGLNAISLPLTITGNMDQARQVDHFMIQGSLGKSWRVHLEAADLGYPWDPVLEVWSQVEGKRLHRQDDHGSGRDPDWVWTPTEEMSLLRVFDLHGHHGPHHWYRLSITEVRPEVTVTVAETFYRGKVGEIIEVPVKIERRHGYAAELEFGLQSSDEVETTHRPTIEAVRSSNGDDSSKQVVLKLSCAEAFSGPIRLLAWESTTPERTIGIHEMATEMDQLWFLFLPNPNVE